MDGTLVERQQIIDTIGTLPSETLAELTYFLDYLRYKSVQPIPVPESDPQGAIVNNQSELGIREKDGILVFETEPLHHVDFTALIEQSRDEQFSL